MTKGSRPTSPPAALVPPRLAADLAGIDRRDLDALIRSGAVRSERIGGKLFVDLDDAERAARPREGGGSR